MTLIRHPHRQLAAPPRSADGGDYLPGMFVLGLGGAFVAALLAGVAVLPVLAGGLLGALLGLLLAE